MAKMQCKVGVLKGIIIFCLLLTTRAGAADKIEQAEAFSVCDHLMGIVRGPKVEFIDWSDMGHPQKIGSLRIKSRKKGEMRLDDVALVKNYAYVAVEDAGISIVDIHDPKHPREIKFIEMDYSQYITRHLESVQYLKVQGNFLYIYADFNRGYRYIFLLDISRCDAPKLINSDGLSDLLVPFVAYPDWTKKSLFADVSPGYKSYYISEDDKLGKIEAIIYGSTDSSPTTVTLNTGGIKKDNKDSLVSKAQGDISVATLGNRLWVVELNHAKVRYQKDFGFKIRVVEFNGRTMLISNEEAEDEYLLIDIGNPDAVNTWKYHFCFSVSRPSLGNSSCMMTDHNLLFADRLDRETNLFCYDLTNLKAVHKVDFPLSTWGLDMKWLLKSGEILLDCGWDIDRDQGFITIAECRDAGHPKKRGTVKGVFAGPKGILVQGNRLYVLDTGTPKIAEENWCPNRGTPKVVDITDLDHPVIRGVYNIKEH